MADLDRSEKRRRDPSLQSESARERFSRRTFLAAGGLAVPAALAQNVWRQRPLLAGEPEPGAPPSTDSGDPPSDLVVREVHPQNLEMRFAAMDRFMTPNDQFYVRNHFDQPELETRDWRLRVEGAVDRPLELSYDELRKLDSKSQPATLECAGNGRAFLNPKAKGVAWQLGAVGNAVWTGVGLADVLRRAGIKPGAVEVVLEGADSGELKDEPKPIGKVPFARSLPLASALRPEVLLAYEMNGKELPPAHGYPLRAVVPGWYGMASIKWLTRVIVCEQPFAGYFQTFQYSYFQVRDGLPVSTPIRQIEVKTEIARPTAGEIVAAGKEYRIFGAAWAGEQDIRKVEISTDGGKSWHAARLLENAQPFCWRLWEYLWQPSQPGKHTLMARATDSDGRSQPLERDANRRNYLINHVLPTQVNVA